MKTAIVFLIAWISLLFSSPIYAQHEQHIDHPSGSSERSAANQDSGASAQKNQTMDTPKGMSMPMDKSMDMREGTETHKKMAAHDEMDRPSMQGLYGPYTMSREASGTAWQPESTPMDGIHMNWGDWMAMAHGFIYGIYNDQEGGRGDDEFYSQSMMMFMAQRPLYEGTLGFRSMFSLDPTMGKDGYPLLFQTGETADGSTPLIDRQHPHDFISELALTYSYPLSEESSVFAYFGLPGEPALGPAAFPHRFPGLYNPEAPLSHHWIDSTHISFGVGTLGYVWNNFKIESSVFRGREPDEDRWDLEAPEFDSVSFRLTYNPTPNWSFQISGGHLDSPEQLEPDQDVNRYTASATYNQPLDIGNMQTTFAWGMNNNIPGDYTNAFLLESAFNIHQTHTLFARVERVEKDELFQPGDPLEGTYTVHKATLGYVYDFPKWKNMQWGFGSSVGVNFVPDEIESVYGDTPLSFQGFARMKF